MVRFLQSLVVQKPLNHTPVNRLAVDDEAQVLAAVSPVKVPSVEEKRFPLLCGFRLQADLEGVLVLQLGLEGVDQGDDIIRCSRRALV